MNRILWAAASVALALASQIGYCDDASIGPSKESPRDTALASDKASERLDQELLEKFSYASSPLDKQYLHAACKYCIELTRVELAVRKRWGQKVDDAFIHGVGEKTDDDVRAAEFKLDGDKATVWFKGDKEPNGTLIKIDGVWKYDTHADLEGQSDDDVKDSVKRFDTLAKQISPYAAKVENGEYKDPDSVTADVKRIIDADENSNP